MLSPLKPLLCRHDYYWSERHQSERCRRCGKLQAAEPVTIGAGAPAPGLEEPTFSGYSGPAPLGEPLAAQLGVDLDTRPRPAVLPELVRPSTKVLKAQAAERRNQLHDMLERLIETERPSRELALDAVLALMEDAHSADPVLFGPDAARHFARLHEARLALR